MSVKMPLPNDKQTATASADQKQSPAHLGVRRRSREMALQLLFQSEFLSDRQTAIDSSGEEFLRRFQDDFDVNSDIAEYGSLLFRGVARQLPEIDSTIQSHSAHWKTARMGLVDLSVMRIAVFEMKYLEPRLSPNVAINEAVDIAKTFGSTESGAFVNGILDQVAKHL